MKKMSFMRRWCNEDGNPFVGTVVAVGIRGEDFCSIPSANVPFVLRMLRGDVG